MLTLIRREMALSDKFEFVRSFLKVIAHDCHKKKQKKNKKKTKKTKKKQTKQSIEWAIALPSMR
jgi:hypothetical protein